MDCLVYLLQIQLSEINSNCAGNKVSKNKTFLLIYFKSQKDSLSCQVLVLYFSMVPSVCNGDNNSSSHLCHSFTKHFHVCVLLILHWRPCVASSSMQSTFKGRRLKCEILNIFRSLRKESPRKLGVVFEDVGVSILTNLINYNVEPHRESIKSF